jgi:hypothetical protein
VSTTLNVSLENGVDEINKLCAGENIPGESYLAGFSRLSENIKSASSSIASTLNTITFGGVSTSSVTSTTKATTDVLDKIVEVLKFRNNIFVNSSGGVTFKDAPEDSYAPLVASLDNGAEISSEGVAWADLARTELPGIARSELRNFEFATSIDGLRDFFDASCGDFTREIDSETGDRADVANSCSP